MDSQDFLVELGTEELPPTLLSALSDHFSQGVLSRLAQAQLTYTGHQAFATPRRLALLVTGLTTRQPDQAIERRGPALAVAYDAQGQPTPAAEGFARANGVTVKQLTTLDTPKGTRLAYRSMTPGAATADLLPDMVSQALATLPIPKPMRWGARRDSFVRPVHWLVMLFGSQVINGQLLGQQAGNQSYGHRFHANRPLTIPRARDYQQVLEKEGKVLPDFAARRATVKRQVVAAAADRGGTAVIDDDLLDEVTALVEWPVALAGEFDQALLTIPAEALIAAMQTHQKYFPVVNDEGCLQPYFITVANLASRDPQQVIQGNERVLRSRLADAQFFFASDQKTPLAARRVQLKAMTFQAQLGSVFDKTERIQRLAAWLAGQIGGDAELAARAGQLCKSDLVTAMVLEFPELQGIMGQYYATHEGELPAVSQAMSEQYLPRFAGDQLPATVTGCAVALADRLDTLTGLFGIGQPPTGSKDPFGLRRASIGVLRILIDKQYNLDLNDLIDRAMQGYHAMDIALPAGAPVQSRVVDYLLERFATYYQEQDIATELIQAVQALRPTCPLDFNRRIQGVTHFYRLPEAQALAAANKRVANLLAKAGPLTLPDTVEAALLTAPAEVALADALGRKKAAVAPLLAQQHYAAALAALVALKAPVDRFFDQVLVNAEHAPTRLNRYALLQQLRRLFLQVADITLLPK